MDKKRTSYAPAAVSAFMALLIVYVGSYFALIVPGGYHLEHSGPGYYYFTWECYRFGGAWSDRIFYPIHRIDRRLRPDTWN